MRTDWPLTKIEQEIYQGLHYFHYKPLAASGLSDHEIRCEMTPVLMDIGWSWARFEDYRSIDLMQRLVFEHSHDLVNVGARSEPMTSKPEYRQYDPNFGALRLKNNSLSDSPDKIS